MGPGARFGEELSNHSHLPTQNITIFKELSHHLTRGAHSSPLGEGVSGITVPVFQMERRCVASPRPCTWQAAGLEGKPGFSLPIQHRSPSPQPCLCPRNSPAVLPLLGLRSTSQWPSISRPPMVSGGMGRGAGWGRRGRKRGRFSGLWLCPSWEPGLLYSLASFSPKRRYLGLESQRQN